MRRLIHRHAAVLVLALAAGAAGAQQAQQDSIKAPEPAVMTDTAPLPPQDRGSAGAIVLREEPVLAKRAYLEQLAREGRGDGPDTSVMGGSPNPTPVQAPAQKLPKKHKGKD